MANFVNFGQLSAWDIKMAGYYRFMFYFIMNTTWLRLPWTFILFFYFTFFQRSIGIIMVLSCLSTHFHANANYLKNFQMKALSTLLTVSSKSTYVDVLILFSGQ